MVVSVELVLEDGGEDGSGEVDGEKKLQFRGGYGGEGKLLRSETVRWMMLPLYILELHGCIRNSCSRATATCCFARKRFVHGDCDSRLHLKHRRDLKIHL